MNLSLPARRLRVRRELWLLGRLRWQLARNSLVSHVRQHAWRLLLLTMVAGLFLIGDYAFFFRLLRYLSTMPGELGPLLMGQLLQMIFLTFFSMLVFSNTVTSLSTIYLSSDLLVLMASPLRLTTVFISKFVQTLLYSSWMVLLFGLPIFIAFGQVQQATLAYYVWLIPTLLPFLIMPAGLGILGTMLLMRYFPAQQTHKALTVLSVCFMAALVMLIRFLRPERLVREAPDEVLRQFLDSLRTPDLPLLPSTWAAKALLAGSDATLGSASGHIALLWGGAVVIFALTVWVASQVYYTGWSGGYTALRGRTPRRTWRLERVLLPVLRRCTTATRGLLLKDLKLFFRDPAQWSQLLLLGALAVIYLFNIRHLPLNTLFLKNFISILNLGLAGFVLSAVAVRFVFTSTSLEGRSFWIVLASPMAFRDFLREKFCMYIVPLLVLAETLVVVSNLLLKADAYLMLFAVVVILLMTCALTGLGVGLGAMYARFEYDNIAQTAASAGGLLYMVLSLGFIGMMLLLTARPLYVHLYRKFLYQHVGGLEVYLCYAAIVGLCLLTTVLPMRLGCRALERLEF
jgi:ABC-2 type transport system permease protein